MATMNTIRRSRAHAVILRLLEEDLDQELAGKSRFPDRVSFLSIELADPARIRESHARGFTVIVVDEHGNEEWLPAAPADLDDEAVAAWEQSFQGFGPYSEHETRRCNLPRDRGQSRDRAGAGG